MTEAGFSQAPFPVFPYKTVFISDLHLGSNKTAAPYLYEFLSHLDFKKLERLYIVGDLIGGWEHRTEPQQPLPEMERRVLDIINYAAQAGTQVHVIPGNHDEKLRPRLEMLRARSRFETFHPNIIFENESYYETKGDRPVRLKIVHGDQHDPGLFVKPWFKPVTYAVSTGYDMMVHLSHYTSQFCYKYFGAHVSFAKTLKSGFKKAIGAIFSHDSMLKGLDGEKFDGILMGHTHMPGIRTFTHKGRVSYLINDGDWVESATAAYVDDDKDMPKILDYKIERERRGFGDLPDADDPHPPHFAACRAQTDRQVRLIHRLWPARDREKYLAQYSHALHKLAEYRQDRADLGLILEGAQKRVFGAWARERLQDIFEKTNRESYRLQKDGLKDIFARTAADEVLSEADTLFLRTVVREFGVRSERKIRKHEERLDAVLAKLDYGQSV